MKTNFFENKTFISDDENFFLQGEIKNDNLISRRDGKLNVGYELGIKLIDKLTGTKFEFDLNFLYNGFYKMNGRICGGLDAMSNFSVAYQEVPDEINTLKKYFKEYTPERTELWKKFEDELRHTLAEEKEKEITGNI